MSLSSVKKYGRIYYVWISDVSKDSDMYPTNGYGNGNHNRLTRQYIEELEAYKASFGFSAGNIITTSQYVEITDVMTLYGLTHQAMDKIA